MKSKANINNQKKNNFNILNKKINNKNEIILR